MPRPPRPRRWRAPTSPGGSRLSPQSLGFLKSFLQLFLRAVLGRAVVRLCHTEVVLGADHSQQGRLDAMFVCVVVRIALGAPTAAGAHARSLAHVAILDVLRHLNCPS